MQALLDEQCYGDGTCGVTAANTLNPLFLPEEPVEPEPGEPGEPAQVVTIADVERFLPAVVELAMEPDGWAVVGVPANLWTRVQPVVVEADLLGDPAQVRFTPRLYRWQYGDGTTRSTRTGGTSWEDAGLEELSPTPTSHVYLQEADLQASVTVVWSAEYRIGDGPWTGVAGAVASTAPPARVLVVDERTVLTDG